MKKNWAIAYFGYKVQRYLGGNEEQQEETPTMFSNYVDKYGCFNEG